MTVKEVIGTAAELVGVGEKVKCYLEGDHSKGEEETLALLRCFNFIENEVALDYLPLVAEDTVNSGTGRVEYSALRNAAVRILSVKNEDGVGVKYKLYTNFFDGQPGVMVIKYTYTPSEKGMARPRPYQNR